jgi:hypothetical protein
VELRLLPAVRAVRVGGHAELGQGGRSTFTATGRPRSSSTDFAKEPDDQEPHANPDDHPDKDAKAWRIANLGFAVMTVSTIAGLWTVPGLVGDRGASLALAAAGAYALASSLWLISLTVRIAVQPAVASGSVGDATIDPAYGPVARLSGGLFVAFESIAGASLIALGAAILVGGSLAAILGWFAIAIGALLVVMCATVGGTLPAFAYFPTFAIGAALLLGVH